MIDERRRTPVRRASRTSATKQMSLFTSLSLFSDNVPIVLYIVRQLLFLHRTKPGFLNILARHLFAPHRSDPFTALGQRHRHTVHARDPIEQRAERMIDILVNVA